MIRLYINNKEVDLPENIKIEYNYKSLDTSDPTAIQNSFSKTISIPGTPNNNKIFGNYWRLDIDNFANDVAIFNPKQRVPFILTQHGSTIESGYVQLEQITKNGSNITYNVCLYGDLGDFFYNLMTDEEGNQRTLASLYYKWIPVYDKGNIGTALTKEEESVFNIVNWNSHIISSSWLNINTKDTGLAHTLITNDLTAIPVYHGLYDDFENKQIIIDNCGIWGNTEKNLFPGYLSDEQLAYFNSILPKEKDEYTTLKDPYNTSYFDHYYGLLEVTRDVEPFEAGDLRSSKMNIGLKASKLFNAITNPENNGGYNVKFDDSIKNSDYYKYSWIMLNAPDWEKTDSAITDNEARLEHVISTAYKIVWTIEPNDVTTISNPTLNFSFTVDYHNKYVVPEQAITLMDTLDNYRCHGSELDTNDFYKCNAIFIVCYVKKKDGTFKGYPSVIFMGSNLGTVDGVTNITQETILNQMRLSYNGSYPTRQISEILWSNVYTYDMPKEANSIDRYLCTSNNSRTYASVFGGMYNSCHIDDWFRIKDMISNASYFKSKMDINDDEIDLKDLKVEIICEPMMFCRSKRTHINYCFSIGRDFTMPPGLADLNDPRITALTYAYGSFSQYLPEQARKIGTTDNSLNLQFAPNLPQGVSSGNVTNVNNFANKQVLLGGTESPFKYLTDFTKMLNLRYLYDKLSKTVNIIPRSQYYYKEIYDLSKNIDYSKDITITPNLSDKRYKSFNLKSPETYPVYLYKKVYKKDFSSLDYDTHYEFNNDKENLFEDNIYTNLALYRISTPYIGKSIIPMTNAPSIDWTLYKDNGENNNKTTEHTGIPTVYANDYMTRLCLFDKGVSHVDDTSNSFVFFNAYERNFMSLAGANGKFTIWPRTLVTDKFPLMDILAGGETHLWQFNWGVEYNTRQEGNYMLMPYAGFNPGLPHFSKFLFTTENDTFNWTLGRDKILTWYLNNPYTNSKLDYKNTDEFILSSSKNLMVQDTDQKFGYEIQSLSDELITNIKNAPGLYDIYWKDEIEDIYSVQGKAVTLTCRLPYAPDEAMRHIYYFEGCYWILTEINGYDVTSIYQYNKCKFVRVQNIENYTT